MLTGLGCGGREGGEGGGGGVTVAATRAAEGGKAGQARRKGRWHVKESGVVWSRVDGWWKGEAAPALRLKSDSSKCGLLAMGERTLGNSCEEQTTTVGGVVGAGFGSECKVSQLGRSWGRGPTVPEEHEFDEGKRSE